MDKNSNSMQSLTSWPQVLQPACVLQSEEELPERLAGSVRFNHLRLKGAAYLDEEAGRIYKGQAMEDDS